MNKYILVTGGAGYIGSHTCTELIKNNYTPIIIDNLSNSSFRVIEQLKIITNTKIIFHQIDINDTKSMREIFLKYNIESVIHFAGLKSVNESYSKKNEYYTNNVIGSQNLIKLMSEFNIYELIFSSSAAVYGNNCISPITENNNLQSENPYANNKIQVESFFANFANENKRFSIVSLRYFNPVGAHPSYLIGENPNTYPSNLMPLICKVAKKEIDFLEIYGNDYPTNDGTGIRDYIHIMDLVNGHISALNFLKSRTGYFKINLGTGSGISVIELINKFEEFNNVKVNFRIGPRRKGDIPIAYADNSLAIKLLGWKPTHDIESMVRDSWAWELSEHNI